MAQIALKNIFSGKMNMDVNPSMLQEGDYIFAENCRIGFSEEDNMGCVENVKSTLKIVNSDVTDESGRFKCIGQATYEAKSIVFGFIKDMQGQEHGIYEFNLLNKTITKVIKNPVLNFTTKILTAVYQNDMLTWTDGNSETRQLIVSLAKMGWYDTQKYASTTLIKYQPDRPITCTLINGDAEKKNTLGSATYQFIYRYVFVNFQSSAWCMPSRMIATGYDKDKKAIELSLASSEILNAATYKDFIRYVEIGVRTNDIQPYQYIGRYNFPLTSGFPLKVNFYNDSQYPAIATSETLRYYDDVPRTSQALTIASSRIEVANNKRGFDNIPTIQALNMTVSEVGVLETNGTYFKSGAQYGVGVTLYDRYQRRTFTYPLGGFTALQRNGAFKASKVSFGLTESNPNGLPDWAEYWAINLTKAKNVGKFVQVHVEVIGTPTATKIEFSPTFKSPTSPNTAWVFTTGDLCNLRSQADGSALDATKFLFDIPLQLDSTSGNLFIETTVDKPFPTTGVANDMIVEFYTPIKTAIADFYYEIGELNPVQLVSGKKRFGNNYSANAALVELTFGDTQYRNGVGQDGCEAMSPSTGIDYEIWNQNIGRANATAQQPETEINDVSNISYSNPYIVGTNLNGWNTFEFASSKNFPLELGAITKIGIVRDYQVNGSVMLVVTEYNCYSIYIGKVQLVSTNGDSQLATTDSLLGSYNLLSGGYGSINPESVHFYGTTARGFDALKGVIWRYSQDGLTPISMEYGANAYISNLATDIQDTRDNPMQTAVGAYDPYFDEYLVNIKDVNEGNIIAFCEAKKGFSTFYSMNPDWMATINRQTVFWKNGVLYLGRAGNDYNNLLGERVVSKISCVFKFSPFITMNGISLFVYAQDNWSAEVDSIKRTKGVKQLTQKTGMVLGVADGVEDRWQYPIAYDKNNIVPNPMKSRYFVVKLSLNPNVDYLSVLYGTQVTVSSSDPNPKQ